MTDTPRELDETLVESARRRPKQTPLVRGELLGRYVVLQKLGAGGMGVVFAAYDPELDRKVALKLLHAQPSEHESKATEGHKRLLREAQAMAKLSHPNVIAIHDVGEHAGRVFLAMEFVDGQTLREWLEQPRGWRAVIDVFQRAGNGLAAAHEKGLVHRDFKPDNVMVGDDGRVRVMDFGLAHSGLGEDAARPAAELDDLIKTSGADTLETALTRHGAMLGTPAYMAAEQWAGAATDGRTDQFSFCVALYEALYGQRPFAGEGAAALALCVTEGKVRDPTLSSAPRWLWRVCLRGLALEPERRFPSMSALLAELARGQSRARTRKLVAGVGVLALLGGGAQAYGSYDQSLRIAACEGHGESIAEVWNADARRKLREALLATETSYAAVTAEKVMPWLDAQAKAWRTHRTEACIAANVADTLDPERLDAALWCLDERRLEFSALVAELSRADETVVQKAVLAAAGLSQVSPCVDPAGMHALATPPPREVRASVADVRATLSRAAALSSAGKRPEALEVLRPALAQAETLDWPPLSSAARRLEGSLLEKAGKYPEAESASVAAYMEAAKANAWEVAETAAASLVSNVGYYQARHHEGRMWAAHAKVAAKFTNDGLGLREARRLNNLAAIHYATGDYAESKALHVRALAIRETALGSEHPSVAQSLNNLGLIHYATGAHVEASALLGRALIIWEKALGPEHPDVAASLTNLANVHQVSGAHGEAKALYERGLAIYERTLGPDHPSIAASLNNLADVHETTGAYTEAKALHERALAISEKALGPEHPDVARSLTNLAMVHVATGALAEAKPLLERGLTIYEKALGPEHPNVAHTLTNLGDVELALGRPANALGLFERAVAIFDGHEGQQGNEPEARFALARTLLLARSDQARAVSEARKAAQTYREAGEGKAKKLDEVLAWLAVHGESPG